MNENLLIKILELLEKVYPADISVKDLIKNLKVPKDGEFSRIIAHLLRKQLIQISDATMYNINSYVPQLDSRISIIIPSGVEYLDKIKRDKDVLKIMKQQSSISHKQNNFTGILAIATAVLAIGTILQAIFFLVFNGLQTDINNVLGYVLIIFLLGLAFLLGIMIPILNKSIGDLVKK